MGQKQTPAGPQLQPRGLQGPGLGAGSVRAGRSWPGSPGSGLGPFFAQCHSGHTPGAQPTRLWEPVFGWRVGTEQVGTHRSVLVLGTDAGAGAG